MAALDQIDLSDETLESETDVTVDFLDKIYQTVLWSTDWTVETIINSLERDSFDLDPNFQRRNAWNPVQKSRLIESLIFNLPIPQIVLAESRGKRGTFIVVDGKQRLLTIKSFFQEKNSFRLSGLNNTRLNGLDKHFLQEKFPDYYSNLMVYSIRSVIIKNWPSDNFLYTIFYRLNTGSVTLSPQELRKSLKPGEFLSYIDDFASGSKEIKKLLGRTEPDPRMKDIDLILRFLAFKKNIANYRGNYKEFIDQICDIYNQAWPGIKTELDSSLEGLEKTIATASKVFGQERVFRRQGQKRAETRINRALFDVITYYFSIVDQSTLLENAKSVKDATIQLQSNDQTFVRSISLATNGLTETRDRFSVYGKMLGKTLGLDIMVPSIGA